MSRRTGLSKLAVMRTQGGCRELAVLRMREESARTSLSCGYGEGAAGARRSANARGSPGLSALRVPGALTTLGVNAVGASVAGAFRPAGVGMPLIGSPSSFRHWVAGAFRLVKVGMPAVAQGAARKGALG
ncbi:hypothetical protein B5F40_04215 [Gordonibacter sp. An230]|nr:hypothetical protein B5F40_04215 [Gordonibacter sp. An230]